MWAAWVYLAVSTLSLTVQTVALARIVAQAAAIRAVRRGLLRTATCRVVASATYVALGVAAILSLPGTGTAAFVALVLIQGIWQANAVADARLARRLQATPEAGALRRAYDRRSG